MSSHEAFYMDDVSRIILWHFYCIRTSLFFNVFDVWITGKDREKLWSPSVGKLEISLMRKKEK